MAMNFIEGGSSAFPGEQRPRDVDTPHADADAAPAFESRLRAAVRHRVATPVERSPRRQHERPEDGSLLALLASMPSLLVTTVPPDAQAAAPASLTPNDVAATVAAAWMASPSDGAASHASATGSGSQWTFALEDPLTPLGVLRVSGDPDAGWMLRVTAAQGMAPHHLAGRAERLRQRLLARGQPVTRLDVDEEEP